MPSFASALTPQQRWNIINYVYTLRGQRMSLPVARPDATAIPGDTASPVILALLDSALDFAKSGKTAEAGDRAFDAYIAFEPLETSARAKKPGLVSTMERHFADFKGAVKRDDLPAAKRSRDAIADALPSVIDLTQQPSTSWEAFFQSLLIILREGFEAILVIGAVVAFLIKMGHRERLRSIWLGILLGLVASLATAVVLKTLLAAMPASREIVEAVTMLIAVVVLFSVSYWLISKVEAAKWQKFIRAKVTAALDHGGGKALALVAFLAVYREGAETALFYQALFNEGPNVGLPLALGIIVGFALLAVIFTLFYRYGVKIPLRPFFTVTSILLYYMAFVFMGKGIRELQEGNIMRITVIPGGPHVDAMGIYPSVETLIAQGLLVLLLLFATLKTFWPNDNADILDS
jgi:high-affinity iron transporter